MRVDRRPRIEIAAVASNEGPYITEWIHHHLHFGADALHVVVNRSSDHTRAIVAQIARREPRVQLWDGDAFETATGRPIKMQEVAYRMVRADRQACDHLLFIDIDEFWLPRDGESRLPDWFEAAGWPEAVSFNWAHVVSDTAPFMRTLHPQLAGRLDAQVKSATRNDIPAYRIDPHSLRSLWPVSRRVVGAGRLLSGQPGRTENVPLSQPEICIAHRMWRSPVEYLAILGRMRPHETDKPFKSNRLGYQVQSSAGPVQPLEFGGLDPIRMEHACAKAQADWGVTDMVAQDRTEITQRARVVLDRFLALSPPEREIWIHGFLGLDIERLDQELSDGR